MAEENATNNSPPYQAIATLTVSTLSYASKKSGETFIRHGYSALGTRLLGLGRGLLGSPMLSGLFFADVVREGMPVAKEYAKFRSALDKDIHQKLLPVRDGLENLLDSNQLDLAIGRHFINQYDNKNTPVLKLLQTAQTIETVLGNQSPRNASAKDAQELMQSTIKSFTQKAFPDSEGSIRDIYKLIHSIPTELEDLQKLNKSAPQNTEQKPSTPSPQF